MAIITRWRMPPGKLMWIIIHALAGFRNVDQFQQFHGALARLFRSMRSWMRNTS